MKTAHHRKSFATPSEAPSKTVAKLRSRLAEAEETLRAIRSGEVDTVTSKGKKGLQVFTLEGAEHPYRVLIESMHEGALTLTESGIILYANQRFAEMVKEPLQKVMGSSFRRFISGGNLASCLKLVEQDKGTGQTRVLLKAGDGSQMPTQISISLISENEYDHAIICMVVTDLTETRRTEQQLRLLAHRVVQAQEAERSRVALELHDNITQLLCAITVRSHTLANNISGCDKPAKKVAATLSRLVSQAAEEVERISRNLRPSVLADLGLNAILRDTAAVFTERTGICVELSCEQLRTRLATDTELTLYRILQEALKNVEKHAHASQVAVTLRRHGKFIQLAIKDNGTGFAPSSRRMSRKESVRVGLLSMRERAIYAGGVITVKSVPGAGTEIAARIPLRPGFATEKGTGE